MLEIKVLPPLKTATRYEFRCLIQPARSRVSRLLNRAGAPGKSSLRFGYRARNFEIPHHEIWDGFYPLIALTRHGGPLFDTGHDEGRIRFTFPISAAVRDFFIRRAADNGIHIEVEAELRDMCFHRPASGDVLAFGGGKDSRLILGMLREQGVDPAIVTARAEFASDLPEALVVEPIQPRLINRIMPSFMQLGCRLYYGGGLGESHRVTPWHEYYDMASSRGRHELSGLLAALGADTEIRGPVVVLPYNLTQRILYARYPELYAGQISTRAGAATEKSLHVALLKLYHDIPHDGHIEDAVFEEMVSRFVAAQLAHPDDFGARDHRELINREMRAIIWRRRDHPALARVRDDVPAGWDGPWIDFIHAYAEPRLDRDSLDIFRRYAQTVDEAASAAPIRRFPV